MNPQNPEYFSLVEMTQYSGSLLKTYSVIIRGSDKTLYDLFIEENENIYPEEVDDLMNKLTAIGNDTGLTGRWYRRDEGYFGDGVCTLFDLPDKHLRLYFIRFGNADKDLAIVLGGGGEKRTRTLQEDEKLRKENYLLRRVAASLHRSIDRGELLFDSDGFYLSDDSQNDDFIFEL